MRAIEALDLTRKFGNLVAVDGISFSVEAGEIFGFLGPNGAGKTTTINILCTLLRPTSGRALLNGFDVVRQQDQVRQSIGLVFQDPSLDDYLTAQENLEFHAMVYNMPASARRSRQEELLKMMELWDRRNSLVKTFSGGMKRRLELARGLLHRPAVLFLDEPTLGLDPQTRNRIWEYVLRLRQQEGVTIFLTTHYMEEAENAHRIAIIDRGRIVALDTPLALKQKVGADIVTIQTADNQQARAEIQERHHLEARPNGQSLVLEVADGDRFIPTLIGSIETRILSISLRRPTLDDVFLKLTGRQIRDQEMGGMDQMRSHMRPMRR